MIELTWLGHAAWLVNTGRHRLLIDPFLTGSPTAAVAADQVECDYILVSHGHADHVGDTATIAARTGALVVANFEICQWLAGQGVQRTLGHNLGGSSAHPFGRVKLTLAHHSSALPDGSYGGNPAGFLLKLAQATVYFACDTGLFLDMKLIGAAGIDVAVLPIGDLFTMGPEDCVEAVKLIEPKYVLPSHYGTWPPIEQDAAAWAARIRAETRAEPKVLVPGEAWELPEMAVES